MQPTGHHTAALTWIVDLTSGGPLLPLPECPRDDGVRNVCPVATCGRTDNTGSVSPCQGQHTSPGLIRGAGGSGWQAQCLNTPRSANSFGTPTVCVKSHTPPARTAWCPLSPIISDFFGICSLLKHWEMRCVAVPASWMRRVLATQHVTHRDLKMLQDTMEAGPLAGSVWPASFTPYKQ